MENQKKNRIDVNATTSDKTGVSGFVEAFVRKFRTFGFIFVLVPIALLYVLCIGLSLTPGISLVQMVWEWTSESSFFVKCFSLGLSLAMAFIAYGISLIFVVPLVNKLLPFKVKPIRASWFSLEVIPWYYHNALVYLVRYSFLSFVTPSPLNKLFYQMMGMKIGKGSMINTTNISDPCMIEIGDYVTVGGSATLMAHYGQKGMLVIDKLVIKDKATIGLKSSLFGDVVVGEGVLVKAHEAVMPKARLTKDDSAPKKAA